MAFSQLRPLSFGEILDGAFTLYRRHFSVFFVTTLLPYLPVLAMDVLAVATLDPSDAGNEMAQAGIVLLRFPMQVAAYVFTSAALIRQTSQAYLGGEVSRADGYRVARGRFWAVLGTTILYFMAVFLGMLLLVVPGILAALMFFAAMHVAVLERRGGFQALARSRFLAEGAWGRVFGISFVLLLIVYLPFVGLGVGAMVVNPQGTGQAMTSGAVNGMILIGSRVLSTLVVPLFMAATTLLYYDRRVRSEGLDLQVASASLATG